MSGGIDIDDAATDREIPGLNNCRRFGKAHGHEELAQFLFMDLAPDTGHKTRLRNHLRARYLLRQRIQGGEHHQSPLDAAIGQIGQRAEPPSRDFSIGRDAIIGQTVPRRKIKHRQLRIKKLQAFAHCLKPRRIASHIKDNAPAVLGLLGQYMRVKPLWGAAN